MNQPQPTKRSTIGDARAPNNRKRSKPAATGAPAAYVEAVETGALDTAEDVSERYLAIPADGDCGYACFCEAGATALGVAGLRAAVSQALTLDHFEALRAAFAADPRAYAYMRRCRTLRDLQALTVVVGAEAGSRMCVWADWPHLQLMTDLTGVTCLLTDSSAAAGFAMVIKPSAPSSASASTAAEAAAVEATSETATGPRRKARDGDRDEVGVGSHRQPAEGARFLHMARVNQGTHFNLFAAGDRRLFTLDQAKATSLGRMFALD
jgi:hypothetical protein